MKFIFTRELESALPLPMDTPAILFCLVICKEESYILWYENERYIITWQLSTKSPLAYTCIYRWISTSQNFNYFQPVAY